MVKMSSGSRKRSRDGMAITKRPRGSTSTKKLLQAAMRKNVEVKVSELNQAAAATASTWTFQSLVDDITEGVTDGTRVGRSIDVLSIRWKGYITNGSGSELVRLVVIYDRAPNGVQAGGTTVFTSNNIVGLKEKDFQDRFVIMRDESFAVVDGQSNEHVPFDFYVKVPEEIRKVRYQGTAGTAADLAEGNFFIGYVTTGSSATISSRTRINYVDM